VGPRGGRCFGAHVDLGSLLGGLRRARAAAAASGKAADPAALDPLPELTAALRAAFAGVPPGEVTVTLVGGHAALDVDPALSSVFRRHRERSRFSWQVARVAARALPGAAVRDGLVCRFPGSAALDTLEDEARLCVGGQRYHVVGVDRWTGALVSHTRFERAAGAVPADVLRAGAQALAEAARALGGEPPPMRRSRLK
jgi:hypothetical protein